MQPSDKELSDKTLTREQLDKLIDIQSHLVAQEFDLDAFMNLVVQQMENLTPANGVVLELVDGDDMVYRAATGSVGAFVGLRLPRKNSISGLCVETHNVLCSDDTENDSRVNIEACRKVGARSLVVAPLFNNGEAVGVLKIMSDKPNAFQESDIKILQIVAGFLGTALFRQMLAEVRKFF